MQFWANADHVGVQGGQQLGLFQQMDRFWLLSLQAMCALSRWQVFKEAAKASADQESSGYAADKPRMCLQSGAELNSALKTKLLAGA